MEFNLKKVLKALLFSTSEWLSIKDIQAVITRYHQQNPVVKDESKIPEFGPEEDTEKPPKDPPASDESGQVVMKHIFDQVPTMITATQIREAMESIATDLQERNDIFRVLEGPNGFRMAVAPEFADWVRLLRDEPKPQKLRPGVIETLAMVAYRQPITRAEIEAIRGVSADSPLNRLLEHELIYVTGRADLPGRPIQYATTDKFLEFCGLTSIEELPASDVLSPNEISAWIRKATANEDELTDKDVGLPEEQTNEEKSDIIEDPDSEPLDSTEEASLQENNEAKEPTEEITVEVDEPEKAVIPIDEALENSS